MMVRDFDEIKTLLAPPKDVAILSHRNPDGDALGASLALYYFLNQRHHFPRILLPSEFPGFLAWLPESDKVWIYDIQPEECLKYLDRVDLVFLLDFNSLDRIDKLGEHVAGLSVPKILVDHHIDPEPFADHMYWDVGVSSTSELIYEIIQRLDPAFLLQKSIAEALLTGILTDTGSFHHAVSPELFRITADLLKAPVDYERMQDLLFNNQTEKQLRLLGHCLYNRMKVWPEYRSGVIWLNRDDYKKYDIQRGDTEGIVNYLMKIADIDVSAFITEQPNIIKISLRSKGEISVQQLARDHFNGGGHRNASGGYMHASLSSVIEKFKQVIPGYINSNS